MKGGGKWKAKMAFRPKQWRDTLDQMQTIKRSILAVKTATITKKKRHKKIYIAAVLYSTIVVLRRFI